MPTIDDYRNKYPSLKALDDSALIDRVAEVQGVSRDAVMAHMGYKPKARGMLSALNDTVIEGANAVAGGVKSVGDFVAPGNPVSAFIDENIIKAGEAKQSDVVKAEKARYRAEMEGAEGIGDEVGATLGYVARNPVLSLAQAAGSFVLPGAAVKGGGMLASMAGAGVKGATRAGLAGGAVAGAALSGGDAAGTAYELVKKAGGTDEQATEAARKASVLPAVIGAAGGVVGAERLLAGAKGFGGNAASRALKTAGVEGAQEAIEEGVTQYEGQAAAVPFDPTIDPTKGVAGAATMGAVLGGATGGAVSLLSGKPSEAPKVDPVVSVLAAPSVDDAINAAKEAVGAKPAQRTQAPAELPQMDPDDRREVLGLLQVVNRPGVSPNVARFAQSRMDALLAPYRTIPAGEATEMLPVPDARELTDEERAEYVNAVPFSYRWAVQRGLPQPEVTELLPTGDATEVEPIPAADAFEELPAPEAYEVAPVGEASELLPTPDVAEYDQVPAGEASELDAETIQMDDLLARDGEPFTSKTGAQAKAYASGGGKVVAIPDHFGSGVPGYVVRPLVQARPNNTRGTNAGDVARTAGQRADERGRGDGAAGVPDQRPSDVLASPAGAAGQGLDGAGAAGGGTAAPDALSNGFIPGPNGYKVRVTRHQRGSNVLDPGADVGAFVYEVRNGDGDHDPLTMVVNKDGKLVVARTVLTNNQSNGTAWVPKSQAAADAVQALLEQRAGTEVGSAARKAIDAKIAEAVASDQAGPTGGAAGPTLTEGQRVTLNGTPYTVTAANNTAVKLQGADGGIKMVARNSKTFGQIQGANDGNNATVPRVGGAGDQRQGGERGRGEPAVQLNGAGVDAGSAARRNADAALPGTGGVSDAPRREPGSATLKRPDADPAKRKRQQELIDRLNTYERDLVDRVENRGQQQDSAHNSALGMAGLTEDGLLQARGWAGLYPTMKPGVVVAYDGPLQDATGRRVDSKEPNEAARPQPQAAAGESAAPAAAPAPAAPAVVPGATSGAVEADGVKAAKPARLEIPRGPAGDEILRGLPTEAAPQPTSGEAVPAPAPEAAPAPAPERRKDLERRKRVNEMTPDEMRAALLTDDLTGLNNGRWLRENQPSFSHIIAFDADSLKWVNDNMGHEAGDMLLKAWGAALQQATPNSARMGGDEFFALANSEAEAQRIASAVESALAQAVITASTPDGDVTIRGIGASFGIAQDRKAADEALNKHKRDREAAGTRAGRGEQPPGTTRKPAGGQQDQADRGGRENDPAGQEVAPPTLTPKAQAVKEALAAKKGAQPAPAATHKDPGEPAEPVTPAVVREAIKTGVQATDRKPSAMKAELLAKIDAAIADAPEEVLPVWKQPTKDQIRTAMVGMKLTNMDRAEQALRTAHDNRVAEASRRIGHVNFSVEGDGQFKVLNSKPYLEEFRRKVAASPGFKAQRPGPLEGPRDGGENGSGGKVAAFDNMVNEGDLEAASDYADAVGLELDPKKIANATKVLKWRETRPAPAPEAAAQPEAEAPAPAAEQAAAILNAAAEPPKGKERLDVLKDVKAGAITPEEVAAAYPAAPEAEAAPAPAEPTEPEAQPSAVDNFGEQLPPARRNMAAKLSESLTDADIANKPLSEIWPLAENEAIEDTFAAAVAHAARAEIPAKPRVAYKVKAWVQKVKMLRDLAGKIVSGTVTKERMAEKIDAEFASLRDWWSKVMLLEQVDRAQWKRVGEVMERPKSYTYVDDKQVPAPMVRVEVDGKTHWLRGDSSVEGEDRGTLNGNRAGIMALLGGDAPQQRMEFDVRRRTNGAVFINKKGDGQYRPLMEFANTADARKAIADQYDALVAAWEAIKARDNITERDLRSAENRPRAGKDHRQGRDVTPQQFQEQFGFRGGEFGKWVQQGKGDKERQAILNDAYDALMDLADLVGVPPKAIALNGTLGIAFGSRGSGWASAHFEPSNLVINLTKTRGAGALGHEWFHALDNYFSRIRRGGKEGLFNGSQRGYRDDNYITHRPEPLMVHKTQASTPITRGRLEGIHKANPKSGYYNPANWQPDPKHPAGVRPEVEARFAALVQALDKSPMSERARTLDGIKESGDGYWSRTIERAARAFENYLQGKMQDQGYHNDFLANVVPAQDTGRNPERYPYLLPSELQPISEAFDGLFGEMKTRADDAGNVVLFSRAPGRSVELEAADAVGREFWRKIDNGESFTDQEVLDALSINRRGSRRLARGMRSVADQAGTGTAAVGWEGDLASFGAYTSRASWDGDNFNVFFIPDSLAGSADLNDDAQARDKALVHVSFKSAPGGSYELSLNDPQPGTAAHSAAEAAGISAQVGTDAKRYTQVALSYGDVTSRMVLQEAARRLALNIGRTPDLMYAGRDTGARTGKNTGPVEYGADTLRDKFSRTPGARTGVPMADAKAVVATIREALPTAPDIVLHDSVRRAPENLRRLIRQAGADNDVEAVYHDGEIHVFPGNIASIERMQFVVAHHEVRHHGLRSMLGPQMGPAMLRMYASNANLKAAADAKMAAGLADTRILAVEEALADMPVEELQKLTGWGRIVAAARQWLRQAAAKLRRAGLNTLADAMEPEGWTDNDIAALVQRAEDVSRGGAAPFSTGGSTVFQRAYHGTPYRGIERFSTDAIGTGEGAQAYGWGLYFASKREVADFYRRKLSGESDRVFTKDGRTIQGPTELAEAYYRPGRIVRGYGGADKVLEFKRTDNGGWVVKVVGVKANGDPMEFERPRWHATQPDGNTLRDALEEDGWKFSPAGQLYEVEVPEDSELLLWDKPLSEQPAMVREAIREAIGSMDPENAEGAMRKGDDLLGSNAYTLLQTSDRISGAEGASELLASLGVKGIKYLDGTSRDGRRNGHNYVIFSGDDAAIMGTAFSRRADQTQTPDARRATTVAVDGPQAAARQIAEAIKTAKQDDPYATYALRILPSEQSGAQPGEALPESYVWADGEQTDETLDGASAIAIPGDDAAAVMTALRNLGVMGRPPHETPNGVYMGKRVALVKGDRTSAGEDVGEVVVRDAQVVALWDRSADKWGPIKPNEPTAPDFGGAVFSRAPQGTRPQAVRAVQTMPRSPLTGRPVFDLMDAAGNRIETQHHAKTADEALENYRERPARQAAARAAAPAPTYAMPEKAAKAEGSNWRRVQGQEFTALDEDDAYLYHVTSAPAAAGVREQGLVPNAGGMFGGGYANYSAGKVFLTERSGVSYWQEKVGQQLEAAMDNPPAVTVLRIPKDKIKAKLLPDTVGSGDARAPAFYSNEAVFSRSAGTAKTTAQDLVNSTGGVFDFNRLGETKQDRLRTIMDAGRPGWLGLLTRDQIADVYGQEIAPVKEYDQLTREMENQRSKIAQDADDLYNEWAKLPAETNDKLARLMLDATVYSVHPDGAFTKLGKPNDAERQQVHARLKAQYALMGKDGQAIYGKVRDFHKGTLEQLRDALEARVTRQVENGQAKAAALTKIRQAFDAYLKEGPYFPLSRFGDFIVVGTRDADGERVVASYATAGEQAAAARTLEADGFTVKMKTAKTYSRETDGSAGKFIGDVLTTIGNLDMLDATVGGDVAGLQAKLMDDVNQLFIKALPDLSYRKHFMHRKGTPGFSSDMMRGFASSAFHAASHIARLNHGDRMTFALQDAFTAIEQAPAGDFNLHSQVLNELTKRHDAALNPNTHPVAAMLNQVGFVMYLGLSPAAGLINMLQTVMVTMPHLGARYGFGKANASLATALTDITTGAKANAKNGWNAAQSTKLTAAERTMMSELQDEGVIDLTQAHDLSAATGLDTGNVARSKAAFAMARAMKIVGWTFHIPEVMNRQVTALSAYRLEMEKTGDAEKAKDAAREAIKRTHFDYSSSNRARFMQGNVARVLLQFKQYSQNMTYLLGRAAHQALKGESPEVRSIARRQLVATFAVTLGMAGALGLPGLGTAAGLIGMLVGAMDDDDEPWDWKVEFRNLMADTFGKEAGEVLSHGIPRALMPWDISNRVSLGDLWFRDSGREGQSPREAFATDAANILGPTAGTVLGLYTAADHMARGNWSKAAESVVPKFLRDPLKAIREGSDGVTSYNGEPLMDVTGAEVAGRLLGFAPARASEMYEGKAAVMNAKTAIEDKRQSLISRMAKARIDKDADTAAELQPEIAAFNQRNPEFRITGATLAKAIMTRMKNRQNTEAGILLPRTKDSLRDIGRFAEVD